MLTEAVRLLTKWRIFIMVAFEMESWSVFSGELEKGLGNFAQTICMYDSLIWLNFDSAEKPPCSRSVLSLTAEEGILYTVQEELVAGYQI